MIKNINRELQVNPLTVIPEEIGNVLTLKYL